MFPLSLLSPPRTNRPVPYILYECEARIVQPDTMSVTEFENDWILLAKKAMLPVTGGGGGGGGGF